MIVSCYSSSSVFSLFEISKQNKALNVKEKEKTEQNQTPIAGSLLGKVLEA